MVMCATTSRTRHPSQSDGVSQSASGWLFSRSASARYSAAAAACRSVSVGVELGSLSPADVAVELLHGPVAGGDELTDTEIVRLDLAGGDGPYRYGGSFNCGQSGRHGYTVRIVPAHDDLVEPVELGCITWA